MCVPVCCDVFILHAGACFSHRRRLFALHAGVCEATQDSSEQQLLEGPRSLDPASASTLPPSLSSLSLTCNAQERGGHGLLGAVGRHRRAGGHGPRVHHLRIRAVCVSGAADLDGHVSACALRVAVAVGRLRWRLAGCGGGWQAVVAVGSGGGSALGRRMWAGCEEVPAS